MSSAREQAKARQAHPWRRRLPMLVGIGFMVLFAGGAVWLIRGFMEGAVAPPKPKEIKITLVKPPDPPKPPEKPPEPEKIEQKEEVKVDQPDPPPDAPPPDAPPPGAGIPDGPAGGMETDLARGSGNFIGGGGGERRAWYAARISRQLEDFLKRSKRLQGTTYQVVAEVWFDPAGRVTRATLARGSGNSQTDAAVLQEIESAPALRDPLPDDVPQPVKIKVASR